jgi:hypothetical protein
VADASVPTAIQSNDSGCIWLSFDGVAEPLVERCGAASEACGLICHPFYLGLGIASKTAHVFLDLAAELSGCASNAIFIHVCLADEQKTYDAWVNHHN